MLEEQVAQVMNDPIAQELLAAAIPARLGYVGTDGYPRVVPVGIHWTGAQLVVGSPTRSAKVRALRANPKVAATIDTNIPPQKVLMVRGTCSVEIVDGVPNEYLAGAARVVEDDQMPGFERQVRALYDDMALITITPEWATLLDFAHGRIPRAVADLAQQKFG